MDLVVHKVRSSWVTFIYDNSLLLILLCLAFLISVSVDIPASCKTLSVRHTAIVPRASLTYLWWTGSRVFSVVGDAEYLVILTKFEESRGDRSEFPLQKFWTIFNFFLVFGYFLIF
jgi:hypothetical protein